jgi:hypothetical protein
MTEPVVLEAAHFAVEQTRLMADPGILDMVQGLLRDPNAPKGADLLAWLDSHEGMTAAFHVASDRGIKFESIGGPQRAIRALLTAEVAE